MNRLMLAPHRKAIENLWKMKEEVEPRWPFSGSSATCCALHALPSAQEALQPVGLLCPLQLLL